MIRGLGVKTVGVLVDTSRYGPTEVEFISWALKMPGWRVVVFPVGIKADRDRSLRSYLQRLDRAARTTAIRRGNALRDSKSEHERSRRLEPLSRLLVRAAGVVPYSTLAQGHGTADTWLPQIDVFVAFGPDRVLKNLETPLPAPILRVRQSGDDLGDHFIGTWEVNGKKGSVRFELTAQMPGEVPYLVYGRACQAQRTASDSAWMTRRHVLPLLQQEIERWSADYRPQRAPGIALTSNGLPSWGECAIWAQEALFEYGRRLRMRLGLQPPAQWRVAAGAANWEDVRLSDLDEIPNPVGGWLADPMYRTWGGKRGLFVEEFRNELGRGRIAWVPLEGPDRYTPIPVLAEPFHLSFPWTFEVDGELYMSPETSSARELRIYRCVEFPGKWVLERTLLEDRACVDPIIVSRNGHWYLLVGLDSLGSGDLNSELHVFVSDHPLSGEWTPVPDNPQVADPDRGRNGGLLEIDGRLFRVGQRQGFRNYGSSSALFEILELSPHRYRERRVSGFRLPRSRKAVVKGPHTLTGGDQWMALDFVSRAPVPPARRHIHRWSNP